MLRRRDVLAGLAASGSMAAARAETPKQLTVLAHPVILSVCKGSQAGDVTADWRKRTGIDINWVTLETDPLHERLFREASLSQTSIDIGFLVNARAVPRVSGLFEPLDPLDAEAAGRGCGRHFPGAAQGYGFRRTHDRHSVPPLDLGHALQSGTVR